MASPLDHFIYTTLLANNALPLTDVFIVDDNATLEGNKEVSSSCDSTSSTLSSSDAASSRWDNNCCPSPLEHNRTEKRSGSCPPRIPRRRFSDTMPRMMPRFPELLDFEDEEFTVAVQRRPHQPSDSEKKQMRKVASWDSASTVSFNLRWLPN
ncbi:expressed unknown protein [Seminavis robusta]|uniref:Uncharacterized protein n=1 Tax=Seminavis robusta TaxID=568900 RepID=A0A9N8HWH1_9STRA|nr:expressed unknown protein [Seminavis robusta]|eukprot:Sro2214_g319321.1  (153) ;mRNA; r:2777-3235